MMLRLFLRDGERVLPWAADTTGGAIPFCLSRDSEGNWTEDMILQSGELVRMTGWSWAEEEPLTCLCSQCGKTPRNQHLMLALCDQCNFDQDEDRGYQQCRQCGGTAIDGTVCTYCRETLGERYDEGDDGSARHHAREEVVAISYADIPF